MKLLRGLLLMMLAACSKGGCDDKKSVVDMGLDRGHACAVRSDGSVWCWGSNSGGELGDGTTKAQLSPVQVKGIAGAVEVEVVDGSSCARLKAGPVMCWGRSRAKDARVQDLAALALAPPTEVKGLAGVTQLTSGSSVGVCGLAPDGRVKCGQLDSVIEIPELKGATKIAAGMQRVAGVVGGKLVVVSVFPNQPNKLVAYKDFGTAANGHISPIEGLVFGDGLCIWGTDGMSKAPGMKCAGSINTGIEGTLKYVTTPTGSKTHPVWVAAHRTGGYAMYDDGVVYHFNTEGNGMAMARLTSMENAVRGWGGAQPTCWSTKSGQLKCIGKDIKFPD